MPGAIDARLAERGIVLPAPSAPAANYVPFVRTGNLLFISGQIPMGPGGPAHVGLVGDDITIDEAYQAARSCGLALIAHAKTALGDLDRVVRVVKLGGFVRAGAGFGDAPKVVNGASDLFVEVFGDAGRHARFAVTVASLPFNVCVEVDATLEVA